LDRARFHVYADIVWMLLSLDPDQNEFGGIPLALVSTGHCRLEDRSSAGSRPHVTLLLEAGSPLDPISLPIENENSTPSCVPGCRATTDQSIGKALLRRPILFGIVVIGHLGLLHPHQDDGISASLGATMTSGADRELGAHCVIQLTVAGCAGQPAAL
jgi:hypothetical protein